MRARSEITKLRDTSLSTTERGKVAEDLVKQLINDNYSEPRYTLKLTKRSGAVHGDGDAYNTEIVFDSKVKGDCKNINVTQAELEKIRQQAAKMDKVGAVVVPNIANEDEVNFSIVMDLEDFFERILFNK